MNMKINALIRKHKISFFCDVSFTTQEKEVIDLLTNKFTNLRFHDKYNTYYLNKSKKTVLFIIYSKIVSVNHNMIWSKLSIYFNIEYEDIQELLKYFLNLLVFTKKGFKITDKSVIGYTDL